MLLEAFHGEVRAAKTKATADTYRYHIKRFLTYLGNRNLRPELVTQEEFQEFILWMMDSGKAATYCRLAGIACNRYLQFLKEHGARLGEMRCPKLPAVPKRNPFSITETTLAGYSKHARAVSEPYQTALLLLPVSGLRAEELVTLRTENIRVQDGWIIVSVIGKGNKPREIPLLRSVNPVLRTYFGGWRKAIGLSPWVFPNPRDLDKHIASRVLRRWMSKVGKKIGVKLTPHTMRRTYLTLMHDHGVVGMNLARLAGHTDPNFTVDRYVTKRVDQLMKALEGISIPI